MWFTFRNEAATERNFTALRTLNRSRSRAALDKSDDTMATQGVENANVEGKEKLHQEKTCP